MKTTCVHVSQHRRAYLKLQSNFHEKNLSVPHGLSSRSFQDLLGDDWMFKRIAADEALER